jgi:hypothetical protein
LDASFTLPVLVFDFPQNLYTIHAVEGVRLFCTFSLLPIAILGIGHGPHSAASQTQAFIPAISQTWGSEPIGR